MNVSEPEFVTEARNTIDAAWERHLDAERQARNAALAARLEAVHAAEHTQRPDIRIAGFIANTTMSNDLGSLIIGADSCRYCLAEQAAAFGLTDALEAYLGTAAPPRPPAPSEAERAAAREAAARAAAEHEATMHDAYLSIDEYAAMAPANRAVYDLIDNECGGHHANIPGLIDRVVAAVRAADIETSRGAMAPERPDDGIVDIPLFAVEGDTPDTI